MKITTCNLILEQYINKRLRDYTLLLKRCNFLTCKNCGFYLVENCRAFKVNFSNSSDSFILRYMFRIYPIFRSPSRSPLIFVRPFVHPFIPFLCNRWMDSAQTFRKCSLGSLVLYMTKILTIHCQ